MSLAKSLSSVQPTRGRPPGCSTCAWFNTLPAADQEAFRAWVRAGRSVTQLWEVAAGDPDNPLNVGVSAMRLHLRTCFKRDES